MPATIWDDASWKPLPELNGSVTADVCIIGLGGAGLAAMEELHAAGANIVGIDAAAIGGGAAGRNAGFLLGGLAEFFHESAARLGGEIASAIYRQTLQEIDRLAARFPADVRLTGSLRIAASPEEVADCAAHGRALQAHGFAAAHFSGPEGEGLLIPTDGMYQPLHCLRRDASRLSERGVLLFEHSAATTIAPGVVTTPRGRIACDTIIVTVDGGLERLLPELHSRIRTARLQMLATAPARDVSFPRPVYWRCGYEYWRQLPTGEIALGGFRDLGGEAEWTTDATPAAPVQTLLENFLRTHLGTAAPITHRWAACVAYSSDRLPIIEQVRDRVWAVGGYSGTGNIASRLGGRAAGQLARGGTSEWSALISRARTRIR